MKQFTIFNQLTAMPKRLAMVLTVLFTVGVGSMWGAEYSYTFTSKQFSANGSKTLNNVSWTLAGDGNYWGYDGTKGQQFGSGSAPYKTLTLSTSGISGTITKIIINTSGASSVNASFTVSVGGTQYGSSTKLMTSATAYTFTGSKSGEIKFSYTQTSSKALYIKSISVTYETAAATVPVTGVSLNKSTLTLTEGDSETLTATITPANATDKTVTWSTDNSSVATVSNGKVTAVAEGSATITVKTKDGNKTATCSVTVNPKPKYTVTWNVNGEVYETTQVTEGSKPTFPAPPSSCDATSNTFYGWATATWDGKINDVSAKTIYTSANDMPAKAATYHAVFCEGGAGSILINETFDDNSNADSNTEINTTFPNFNGASSKAFKSQYGGIKFGNSSTAGYITSKSLDLSTAFTVTLDACKFSSDAGNIVVTVGSQTQTIYNNSLGEAGKFNTYTLEFDAATSSSTVKISTSQKRAYIDNVIIATGGSASNFITTCTTPSEYTVTFNANGHGTEPQEQTVTSGGYAQEPDVDPTETGYNFQGWYDNANCTGEPFDFANTPITDNITLYAKWTAIQTTITLNANEGSGNTASVKATYDSSTLNPSSITNPSKEGHTFGGWYSGEGGTGSLVINSNGKLQANVSGFTGTNGVWKATTNKTLYAKWTASVYTITYKDQGNTTFSGTHESGNPTQHTYGTATTLKGATKTGYTFGGWYKEAACTNKVTSLGATEYTAGLTLYAQWTANTYSVEFNANGGTGTMTDQSFTYGQSQALSANAFTRADYAFKNWNTKSDGTGTSYTDKQSVSNLSATNGATVTLYAQWTELPTYIVSFSTGTGNPAQESIKETVGGAGITLPTGPTPACDGWEFAGWAETSVEERTTVPTLLSQGNNYKPTENCTLYAVYSKEETDEGGGTTPTEASLSFANKAQRTNYSTDKQVWEQNGITLTNNKSASTSNVGDYAKPARFYASSEIIIEAPGNITQMVATCSETTYTTALVNSVGTGASYNGNVVTIIPDEPSTTYTIATLTAQVQMYSLTVTYLAESGPTTITTTYNSNPTCDICENILTINKGAETNGTFTLDKVGEQETCDGLSVLVTPTPAEHYHVASVTASTSETAVNNGDGTYTITYAANSTGESTINVTFEEDAKASITLSELGEPTTDNTTYYVGETYTLPSTSSQSCEGKQLVGWSSVEVDETDTKPTENYYELDAEVTLETAQTFYAVFATPGEGGGGNGIVFKETFDTNEGTGGNDSQWSGTIASSNILSDHAWSFSNAKGAKQCAKFASNSAGGSATTPEIDCGSSTEATLTFKAGSWKDDKTILSIMATNCTIDLSSVDLPDQEWEEYIVNITSITGEITITFSSDLKNRFFLDEVEITSSGGTSYSDYTTSCDNTKATVTYDLNGGTGATCEQTTVTKDEAFNLCSSTPTKNGYTFAGWSDGTKTYAAGAEVTISESTTFYASWKAKTITITWNLNYTGCPEAETSTYVYEGDEIEMPEDPIRTGYKFNGWYTNATDGTEVTEVGDENKPSADVTYYAQWEKLHTVTFIASGQVYVKQEHKYISDDKLVLPEIDPSAANFACDGYLFEGWSKYQQTKEDANCPELVDANTSVKNDLELHAVWKKASTSGAGTQIFYESFNTYDSPGGNDSNFKTASNTEDNDVSKADNDGWSGTKVYGAKTCVKLGGGSAKGTITTPAITSLSGDATLSFKAAAWENDKETTTLNLSISGGGTLTQTSVTLVKGVWTTYEVQIKGGTPSSTITFAAVNASNNRFFLDEVKITTSGSYNYTTSPTCGPSMVAKEGMWVTSANGQSVKVNVPVGVKQFAGAATITGTSTNENFVVNTQENVSNGEHNLVVVYTPTADDTKENTTITLTAKNGEEVWSTTTFTLNGRSLPTEFVVVANRGDKNYALPANMTEANTYPGLEVEVTGNEVSAAPVSHLYTARAVHSTRFADNGTALRLVGNNDACLWASNAASGTHIRNFAQQSNAKSENYEWNLYTEDGNTYYISSTAVTEEGRVLRLYGNNFGMYKEGVNTFRFFPVGCTSTPMNVQTSTTRTSATISWTNASECNVVVKQGSTTVQSISAAASPLVVGNLAESTTYTFTLTPTDDASCGTEGSFTTTGPTIDIVEWQTGGIRIYVDKDENVNPKVIINGEEEHGNVGGQVATELFFSKYYEAHAENKLLAVYNGTTQTIDLNGYVIKHGTVEIDLSQYGQTKGSIAPNEEIIFVSFGNDAAKSAVSCAEKEEGFSSWNVLETNLLAFSGRGSVGLYKNNALIDLIGSTYPSGELTKIGKSDQGCGTGADVRLHIDEKSVNDQSSFFCYNGDNHKTTEVETDYPISTNRCLLIRKNTVTSGANAVASNKAEAGATCGDLSSTFTTLCPEWSGFRIGSGSSSNAEIQNATCEGLGYVGGFDYNNYYRTMETIHTGKTLNEYDKNDKDNTYFIEFEVPIYSCLNIQLQLTDNDGNVLADQISQVPILVYGNKTTTNELFSAIVKDGENPDYENSKIRCATCDVVIESYATLTKAAPGTENDVNQVRDIYVYPGGKLIVPEGAIDYKVNSLSIRRDQDEVGAATIIAPLNITSSLDKPIYADVRINSENWHWFTLPYDCNIADVTWKNGSKAIYNSDWFLMTYDGEQRAATQQGGCWVSYEGATIEAGKGYIIGITGHPTKSGVQYELRFPMAKEVQTKESDPAGKQVAVNAWGIKQNIRPNHKGWNLVGNPYLDSYQPTTSGFKGLSLLRYTEVDPVTGEWYYDNSGTIPYLVTPINGGWYAYEQKLASETKMKPLTAYFVQVGDPNNDDHENGEELYANFTPSSRANLPKSIIRRAPSEVNETEEPVIVGVALTNSKGESDKTSLVIGEQFTNEYEMNADFFKWFGDYYKYYTKPVLYTIGADQGKRAFNALNEQLATQPIPMGMFAAKAGDYTFALNRRSDLSKVEEVWLHDANTNTYTNLMQNDYNFYTTKTDGGGRFTISVKLAPKVATGMENVNADKVWATTQNQQIIVNGLENNTQLWMYDAAGKLLYTEVTSNYQHRYSVPQVGTYFIALQKGTTKQTIKVVVE